MKEHLPDLRKFAGILLDILAVLSLIVIFLGSVMIMSIMFCGG